MKNCIDIKCLKNQLPLALDKSICYVAKFESHLSYILAPFARKKHNSNHKSHCPPKKFLIAPHFNTLCECK